MSKLKISTRLSMLLGLFALLFVALGGMGLYGIGENHEALRSIYIDRMAPVNQLSQIGMRLQANQLALTRFVAEPATASSGIQRIETNVTEVERLWAAYMATELTLTEAGLAKEFEALKQEFIHEAMKPVLKALHERDDAQVANLLREKVRPLFTRIDEKNAALIQLQFDVAKDLYLEADKRYQRVRVLSVGAILIGLTLSSVIGFLMVRSINAQLGAEPADAAALARSVAEGDLRAPIALRSGDGSSLMAQMKDMQSRLSQLVTSVRRNSESVATASAEISQGNNDLSQRTEEQASAVQETATALDQLVAVFRRNSEAASRANLLSQSASDVAQKGGKVVSEVVDTMRGINDSSRLIADIIGVIDSIAFQTNILALNAAVEAARAGDQGRGFAVVASEVRSLAGRSSEAAREIKQLISASVERVERGSELVNQAGATMLEVVRSIEQVREIVAEISRASGEQSEGFSQVGQAVNRIDQNTQQNAALVEQSAAAAESLRRQAESLLQLVEVFKTGYQS